ncbi:uncharacterized protein A1O9_08354 [Exophiala aquamarina CBS 119918]|uniref:Uncharacterized protein n=1 Tax=Exophiala aquamarina CBS 119918 TaxID=1182545 RepID=A0A072P658_9EURO|nr:uncharacterized protein A1O9_08354 [Exophiala aquamarina CBS 119918]KEF55604.1 hypothetical protein A1O9_08354 [Exophiala aquamarina CBS 119918]
MRGKILSDLNLWGKISMIPGFAPLLIAAKEMIATFLTQVRFGSMTIQFKMLLLSQGVYNVSKTAVHLFDETLKIESSILDDKLLAVATGSVRTNVTFNFLDLKVPQGSRYLPAQANLNQIANANNGYTRTPSDLFASKVVRDILGDASGKLWRGNYASIVKFCSTFISMFIMVN